MNGVKLNHWFFWSLLAVSLLAAGMAFGQSVPSYVAAVADTGYYKIFDTSSVDRTNVTIIQVSATTNMRFTFWYPSATIWPPIKLYPIFGAAPSDSTIFIPAGQSEGYSFPRGKPKWIFVSQGTGEIKGE